MAKPTPHKTRGEKVEYQLGVHSATVEPTVGKKKKYGLNNPSVQTLDDFDELQTKKDKGLKSNKGIRHWVRKNFIGVIMMALFGIGVFFMIDAKVNYELIKQINQTLAEKIDSNKASTDKDKNEVIEQINQLKPILENLEDEIEQQNLRINELFIRFGFHEKQSTPSN